MHLRAEQGHIAALGRVVAAGIAHHAALAAEGGFAGQRIGIAQARRAGHQAAGIDPRAIAEQDPVGIEQEYLAIGLERAVDHRAFVAGDAVQGHGSGVGLHEGDRRVLADRKIAPFDGGFGAALGDRHGRAVLA